MPLLVCVNCGRDLGEAIEQANGGTLQASFRVTAKVTSPVWIGEGVNITGECMISIDPDLISLYGE